MANFYKCNECGDVVLEMSAAAVPCANKEKMPLVAGASDGAAEKHVPAVSADGGKVRVQVGSVPHPMLPEHHIEWIYMKTSFGGVYCNLAAGDEPEALFGIEPGEVEEVYAYCNLHGLWKAPEPVLPIGFDLNTVACSPEFAAGCMDPSAK